eukprot:20441-Heterococcus_DN1.PRE.1
MLCPIEAKVTPFLKQSANLLRGEHEHAQSTCTKHHTQEMRIIKPVISSAQIQKLSTWQWLEKLA